MENTHHFLKNENVFLSIAQQKCSHACESCTAHIHRQSIAHFVVLTDTANPYAFHPLTGVF